MMPELFLRRYIQKAVDQTDDFADAFVREKLYAISPVLEMHPLDMKAQ